MTHLASTDPTLTIHGTRRVQSLPDVRDPESPIEEARGYLWRAFEALERAGLDGSYEFDRVNDAAHTLGVRSRNLGVIGAGGPNSAPAHLPERLR